MTGAQYLVKTLQQQGVQMIFGYPGGAIMPVYDALYDAHLPHILCRHEQAAVMAAIGYARSTGQVGVCLATSGPGATNLITGLADALLDSIPVIAITGQVALPAIGSDAFQEVDVLGLSLACCKHSFLVQSIEQLPEVLEQALIIAQQGRPGPVLIDLPKDVQLAAMSMTAENIRPLSSIGLASSEYKIPAVDLLLNASQLIYQASKPILYLGGGVTLANSQALVRQLVANTKIPQVVTLKGLGVVDPFGEHYLGMLGMHGHQAANLAVQQADLLIAIGVRFDDRVTGKLAEFAPNAKVIHLDIDPAELGKLRQPDVALCGDINELLPLLMEKLNYRPLAIADWLAEISVLKAKFSQASQTSQQLTGQLVLQQLAQQLSTDTIVTTDVGQHQMWAAQALLITHPKNFISSSGLGTMGFGLPAAIGAQLANPQKSVVCISGDGSLMMNIQELATVKRYQLPIKILLLDNQRLGMVRQWQQLFFAERYSETNLADNPDFTLLAQAFAIEAQSISQPADLPAALQHFLQSQTAYLLHIAIEQEANVWPLVPPGSANHQMLFHAGEKRDE